MQPVNLFLKKTAIFYFFYIQISLIKSSMSSLSLIKAFLIVFLSLALVSSKDVLCQFNCNSNCLVPTIQQTLPDGSIELTIDASSCKHSSVNWIACMNGGCSALFCDGIAVTGTTKCDTVMTATYLFPKKTGLFAIFQVHDGAQAGNFDCSVNFCPGGAGGGCNVDTSGTAVTLHVCQEVIPFSTSPFGSAPQCTKNSDCTSTNVCAIPYCGTDGVCYSNLAQTTQSCRFSAGPCDIPEFCEVNPGCPANLVQPTTYECSAPTPFSATDSSTCELPSYCDGTDVTCPDKVILPATTVCRPAAVAADKTASCPANSYKDPNTSCRPAVDLCDAPEVCTGGPACPPDLYEPPTICCRPAVFGADGSTCDNTEYCDGVTTACPADTPMPATAVCRPAADLCDVPERCSGTSDSCPPNQRNDDGYVYKCGLTCFLCAVHQNQLTLSSGTSTQAWNLGGCGIGACDNFVTLKWPDCTTQCINALCPNNKALSNSEIYSCVKSTGHWVCDYKLDGTAVDNGV